MKGGLGTHTLLSSSDMVAMRMEGERPNVSRDAKDNLYTQSQQAEEIPGQVERFNGFQPSATPDSQ